MFFTHSKRVKIKRKSKNKLDNFNFLLKHQFVIISKIWWQVLLVGIYTLVVMYFYHYYNNMFPMGWSTSLVPILGVVTGLLLVFRTNTAYDRYYEGRRLWSQMTQAIGVLVRATWIIVPEKSAKDIVEKKTATNFLVAFAIASKHYLREEFGYDQEDLSDLIHHFPEMLSKPRLKLLKKLRVLNYAPPSNIPLQILYHLAIFIQTMKKRYNWDPATSSIFYNGLNTLAAVRSGFERIKRTPIPAAYSVHLYHVIWLYILSLPFQLVESMGWWTIAGVCITSFTFLGILEIGFQIEDPFGYDDNDLPLEDLCDVLKTEINDILSIPFPSFDELFVSNMYFPIPNCNLSAFELSLKTKTEVQNLFQQHQKKMSANIELPSLHLTNVKVIT